MMKFNFLQIFLFSLKTQPRFTSFRRLPTIVFTVLPYIKSGMVGNKPLGCEAEENDAAQATIFD